MILFKKLNWKICFILFVVFLINCSDDKKDKTPPELSVPFVDTSLTKEFLAFGYELHPGQLNPAYEIVTSTNMASVYAATSGVVTRIEYNGGGPGQNDYEVFIKPKKNSIYLIIYDHVDNLAVSKGDTVTPGALLGTVGDYGGGQGRIELQINNESSGLAHCPESMGTTTFNDAMAIALNLHNADYSPGDDRYFSSVCLTPTAQP